MAAEPILKHVALSIRQLSTETGLARDTVRKRLDDAEIPACAKRGGHPVYRLRDVLPALYYGSDEGGTDPDKLKPFERHAHYKAEREKLHLQTERGDVVPAIEVEQTYGRLHKLFVRGLETLADMVERDVGLTPQQAAKLERHIDALRERLHQALTEVTGALEDVEAEDDAEVG